MPLDRKKNREIIFQMLFSFLYEQSQIQEEIVALLMKKLKVSKKNCQNAFLRCQDIQKEIPCIDKKIALHSQEYAFDRISKVELIVLRLALYEMFYDSTIPVKVSIAEAIRITRKFGTKQGANFVNAILDVINKKYLADNDDNKSYTK